MYLWYNTGNKVNYMASSNGKYKREGKFHYSSLENFPRAQ